MIFAFLDKRFAYFNLYYLIPLTYLSYIVFHGCVIHTAENAASTLATPEQNKPPPTIFDGIFSTYANVEQHLKNRSCYNIFSPQAIMLFGIITSAYRLKK